VPNGVNVDRILPGNAQASGIVFIGGASWFPNRDALAYFAREILPQIRQQSDASVTWVGNADAAARAVGEAAGIQMTGFVPDILPYLHAATCFIAPLRVGGGTRLKILDAWAAGLPVVSTPIGCEGHNAVDGLNILIREDPTAFADAVLKVLRDSALQSALGSAARATAEADYSWDVIGQRMLPLYRAVAEGRAL
jgi:glycosyltransferase involved in cell wall biosynthesis